jgi:hypothetical protein
MDSIERNIRDLYLVKKGADELNIPPFKTLDLSKKERGEKFRYLTFFKMVAAMLVVCVGFYLFWTQVTKNVSSGQASPAMIRQFPTEGLLREEMTTEYIWNWASPTDHLLPQKENHIKPKYSQL